MDYRFFYVRPAINWALADQVAVLWLLDFIIDFCYSHLNDPRNNCGNDASNFLISKAKMGNFFPDRNRGIVWVPESPLMGMSSFSVEVELKWVLMANCILKWIKAERTYFRRWLCWRVPVLLDTRGFCIVSHSSWKREAGPSCRTAPWLHPLYTSETLLAWSTFFFFSTSDYFHKMFRQGSWEVVGS